MKMKVDELLAYLNSDAPSAARIAMLRVFLVEEISCGGVDRNTRQLIAYRIAGLMATQTFTQLPEGSPYIDVLGLAGELELPLAHRSQTSTWDRLVDGIRTLPDN